MTDSAPRNPDQITTPWVESVLSAFVGHAVAVRSIAVEVIGQGFIGTVARVVVDGDDPAVPDSFVVKFSHADAEAREQIWEAGIYHREARFYRDLADSIPLNTPVCLLVENDRAADVHLVALEDLSAATLFNQLDGCPADRAGDIVDDLATLHRTFWASADDLGIDHAADDQAWFDLVASSIPAMLARDDLTPELVWLTENYAEIGPRAVRLLAQTPTLLHSDARIENVFFHPDRSRTWIDWDGIQIGGGGADLAYFMSQSLTIDDRRKLEGALIERYVDGIARGDFTTDDARAAYRRGIVAGWAVGLAVVGVYGENDEQAQQLVTEGIRRVGAALADTDALREFR